MYHYTRARTSKIYIFSTINFNYLKPTINCASNKKYKNEINVGMTNKCKECEQYIRDVNASFIHKSTGIECNIISLILFR